MTPYSMERRSMLRLMCLHEGKPVHILLYIRKNNLRDSMLRLRRRSMLRLMHMSGEKPVYILSYIRKYDLGDLMCKEVKVNAEIVANR